MENSPNQPVANHPPTGGLPAGGCAGPFSGCAKCWGAHRVLKVVIALAVLAIVFAAGFMCGTTAGRFHQRLRGWGNQENHQRFNGADGGQRMMFNQGGKYGMRRVFQPTTATPTPASTTQQ